METLLDLVMARIERSLATLRYSVTDILPVYFSVDFQQKKTCMYTVQRRADIQEPTSPSLAQAVSIPQLQVYDLIKVFLLAVFNFNVRHILCRRGTRHTLDDLPKEGSGGCSC